MKKRIAAIDVGTTKVCTIMGTIDDSSGLRITGLGLGQSHGIEKALVADAVKARDSIRESIRKAEMMAGYKMNSAYLGVTGRHISSMNNKGTIAINHQDMLVRASDKKRSLNVALGVEVPAEKKILHVIPRSYRLDGQEVQEPVGMSGYELETDVHIITASMASIQNLTRTVKSLGKGVDDLVLKPLASAEAVLSEEEKEAGVLIADIGGGTTDIAIIKGGSIYYTSVIPVAGHQMTTDLSVGLGLSYDLAEEMKRKYATVIPLDEEVGQDAMISYNSGPSVNFINFNEILYARVEELIRLIVLDLPKTKTAGLIPAGIVLTGGCSNIPGIADLAARITRLPVRVGTPVSLGGVTMQTLNNPAYATSVGLVLWVVKNKGTSYWFNKPRGIRGFFSQMFRLFK